MVWHGHEYFASALIYAILCAGSFTAAPSLNRRRHAIRTTPCAQINTAAVRYTSDNILRLSVFELFRGNLRCRTTVPAAKRGDRRRKHLAPSRQPPPPPPPPPPLLRHRVILVLSPLRHPTETRLHLFLRYTYHDHHLPNPPPPCAIVSE